MPSEKNSRLHQVDKYLILALFVVAFLIRIWGIDWGLPAQSFALSQFNFDETAEISGTYLLFSERLYHINLIRYQPFFYYASVPAFVAYFLFGFTVGQFSNWSDFIGQLGPDLTGIILAGRIFIAVAGSVTVSLLYLVGMKLFDRRTGFAAAIFLLFSFGHVIYSRIYRLDSFLPLILLLAIFSVVSLRVARPDKLRPFVIAGAVIAATATTKITGLSMLFALLAYPLIEGRWTNSFPFIRLKKDKRFPFGLTVFVATVICLTAPYLQYQFVTRLSRGPSVQDTAQTIGNLTRGLANRFTASSVSRDTYALSPYDIALPWHLSSTLPKQLGWFILFAAFAGLVLMVFDRQDRRQNAYIVIATVAFIIPIGFLKRIPWRDMIPILPLLALCAGHALSRLVDYVSNRISEFRSRRAKAFLQVVLTLIMIIGPAVDIYRHTVLIGHDDTRIVTQRWVEAHIPTGSRIAMEPFSLPILDSSLDPEVLSTFDDGYLSGKPRPTYTIIDFVDELGGTRWPDDVIPFLNENDIDYVVVSSAFYGRYYGDGLQRHDPQDAEAGQKMHEALANNLDLLVQIVPNWDTRPGPVIQIFSLSKGKSDSLSASRFAFEPFPGMERPASAVGYYQFQPR